MCTLTGAQSCLAKNVVTYSCFNLFFAPLQLTAKQHQHGALIWWIPFWENLVYFPSLLVCILQRPHNKSKTALQEAMRWRFLCLGVLGQHHHQALWQKCGRPAVPLYGQTSWQNVRHRYRMTVRHRDRMRTLACHLPYLWDLVLLTLEERLSQSVQLRFRQENISHRGGSEGWRFGRSPPWNLIK